MGEVEVRAEELLDVQGGAELLDRDRVDVAVVDEAVGHSGRTLRDLLRGLADREARGSEPGG